MADKKLFKFDNILASADAGAQRTDFFDALNLPPAAAEFLNVWYRHILGIIALGVVVILAWSFSQQYLSSRDDRASALLAKAMQQTDPAARTAALEEVASSYRRTGAGLWSRIDLAHQARDNGGLEEAAQAYQGLLDQISRSDPRHPMVKLSLAQVLVELGRDQQAATLYDELAVTPAFEAWGLLGAGEILDRLGNREAARQNYQQVLELENAAALLREQAETRLR